jgi:hypothetical protein
MSILQTKINKTCLFDYTLITFGGDNRFLNKIKNVWQDIFT